MKTFFFFKDTKQLRDLDTQISKLSPFSKKRQNFKIQKMIYLLKIMFGPNAHLGLWKNNSLTLFEPIATHHYQTKNTNHFSDIWALGIFDQGEVKAYQIKGKLDSPNFVLVPILIQSHISDEPKFLG